MPRTIAQTSLAVPCNIISVAPNKMNKIKATAVPHQNPVIMFLGTQFL